MLRGRVEGLELGAEISDLLSDTWKTGSLLLDYIDGQGCTDVETGPLMPAEDGGSGTCRVRTVTYSMALPPHPFSPRTSRFSVAFRVLAEGDSLVIDTTTVTHDVPFGETFCVQDRARLVPCGGGVEVEKAFGAVFIKSTVFRSKIVAQVRVEQEKRFSIFMRTLEAHALRHQRRGAAPVASQPCRQPLCGPPLPDPPANERGPPSDALLRPRRFSPFGRRPCRSERRALAL